MPPVFTIQDTATELLQFLAIGVWSINRPGEAALLVRIPVRTAKEKALESDNSRTFHLAGETRFEHATSGFGDRCSTIEPLP